MSMKAGQGIQNNRGIALLMSYMFLSAFLAYSMVLTLRTVTARQAVETLRNGFQAMDLAQGAMEQLREDMSFFLTNIVSAQVVSNNLIDTLQWLDSVGTKSENPIFDIPLEDRNRDGLITVADGDGIADGRADHPRCIDETDLPTIIESRCAPATEAVALPRAWITQVVSTNPADPLAPRDVTIIAEAKVGSTTKQIRATYRFALGLSDIFRYAYFVNNYGWFSAGSSSSVVINGEVRANGNLAFLGDMTKFTVNGDLYASDNPAVIQPQTWPSEPATGSITGDPSQMTDLLQYWQTKSPQARPARNVTFPGQPAIGGVQKILPYGMGWDSDHPEQRRFESQPTQDIPYLGDLSLYRDLSKSLNGELYTWWYDSATNTTGEVWIHDGEVHTYKDWYDGSQMHFEETTRSADDPTPLVIQSASGDAIWISGPVVVGGDVIIKGSIYGQGTIYSGRNVHIVGDIKAIWSTPEWPTIERQTSDGTLIVKSGYYSGQTAGRVCNDGTYVVPGGQAPAGCVP